MTDCYCSIVINVCKGNNIVNFEYTVFECVSCIKKTDFLDIAL